MAGVLLNLIHVSAYIALYYAVREILIPKYFDKERWFVFGSGVIGWTVIVVVIWNALISVLGNFYPIPDMTIPESYGGYLLEAVQMYVPGLILLAWESYDDAEQKSKILHELEKEQLSTELNFLKSKVNPQFIFNTLNSLKEHVHQKSDQAPKMILTLSEILDYTLYRGQQEFVKLKEEVDVILGYLQLEKLRLGETVNLILVNHGDMNKSIAPLTLLSFTEQVISLITISETSKCDVSISIYGEEDRVRCDLLINSKNSIDLNEAIIVVERQLGITYPDRYTVSQELKDRELHISLILKDEI